MDPFHTQNMAAFCPPTPKVYRQTLLLGRGDPTSMSWGWDGRERSCNAYEAVVGDEQSTHGGLGGDSQSHLSVWASTPLSELFKDFLSL